MIKRFNPDFSLSISHELAYMRETPEGGYVAYGDYATLFSELEALKADRDAQQKRADALAVRNEQLMSFVVEVFNIAAQHCTLNREEIHDLGERLELFGHETYQPVLHGYHIGLETGESRVYVIKHQPTDAALAAIEARGVEKEIDLLLNKFSGTGHIGVPVMALQSLATELREAK